MFVSFDNGGAVAALQQNLPATPVTDIRVQRGDLVIATMGRSFWIMDDIAPLRQMAARGGRLTLLRPSTRVRYRRAGGGRGAAPQYPPVALAIDYVAARRLLGSADAGDPRRRRRAVLVRAVDTTAAGRGGARAARAPEAPPPIRRWRRRQAAAAAGPRR